MNPLAAIFDHPLLREVPWRSLGVPLLIFMVLAMMIIPLPPLLLDLCFTFNIALALVVMMAAAYTRRPLDFATFPTVLLLTTLIAAVAERGLDASRADAGTHWAGGAAR